MPQAVNLVVKNGAATPVDKTFTLLTPAAGYGGVAEWNLKEGDVSSAFPKFTASAVQNSVTGSRKLQLKLRVPATYQDAGTGLTAVQNFVEFNGTIVVPMEFPESKKADAVAFISNLIGHSLVKELMRDAVPAT